MCPKIKETNKVTSTNTKRTYKIRKNLNCRSSFVIYLGQCKLCRGQYVGKSKRELRERHSGHKQDIKNDKGGLGHHYHGSDGCGYENLQITIIDQVENGNETALRDCELKWQHQLRCFRENGGNGHCIRNDTDAYRA